MPLDDDCCSIWLTNIWLHQHYHIYFHSIRNFIFGQDASYYNLLEFDKCSLPHSRDIAMQCIWPTILEENPSDHEKLWVGAIYSSKDTQDLHWASISWNDLLAWERQPTGGETCLWVDLNLGWGYETPLLYHLKKASWSIRLVVWIIWYDETKGIIYATYLGVVH